MAWINLLQADELPEGERRVVEAAATTLLLIRHQGRLYAVASRCPHMGFPLRGGRLTENGDIVCPLHHSEFNLATGDVEAWSPWPPVAGPLFARISREKALRIYPVKEEENAIWADIPAA
jgi:nitrite reductase/ring-hydroxylating ferredoxin subunit